MHRFRKRSDARRIPVPEASPRTTDTQDALPSLPPASDFRTSLILPDLTRRFSVLRNSSGEPIGLDELKNKFAEQRARGSQNQVTEEEEDMILEALGRLHGKTSRSRGQRSGYESSEGRANAGDGEDDDADPLRQSVHSSTSVVPSLHGAPSMTSISSQKGSQSSRRMSNNLFGSGKFNDQAYFMRSAASGRRTGRGGGGTVAQSNSTMSMSTVGSARGDNSTSLYSDSQSLLRPVTPEGGSTYTASAPSSPGNNSTFSKDRSSRSTAGDHSDYASSSLSKRLSKALSPDGFRRASMALDQAIRELEEEGDDEIVMERSPIAHPPARDINGSLAALTTALESEASSPLPSPGEEAGTALSSDDPVMSDENQRASSSLGSRTTSPTPRLPGYIPGMPRPMTPREATFDSEDLTPSTTPRATSPRLPGLNTQTSPLIPQSFASSMHRSNSSASASYQSNRPVSPGQGSTAPLFFNRSMNGRSTPEDRQRNAAKASSPTSDVPDSPVMGRRRPMSPLSGPAYQPLASPSSRPSSRPGTPSNVTWNTPASPNGTPQKSHGRNGSVSQSGHSRNGSTASINDQGADALERSKSTSRSLRSPALPDSPWVDNGHAGNFSLTQPEYRPPSAMSGMELGSPVQTANRIIRSPTPSGSRSPTSPTFHDFGAINGDGMSSSRHSSKQLQQSASNSFSLGTPNALLFSPIANSSRSSLESAGSSYHTWDEDHKKDRLFGLFSSLDPDYTPWHDISPADKSGPSTAGTSPYDSLEPEDAVRREIGLTKSDFVAIQDKLVSAALTKAATPENRARAGSIRKRRPSTSQSNYSFNGDSRAVNSTPQPQPQPQASVTPPRPSANDHVAKANALLNAVVDSIESPSTHAAEKASARDASLGVPQTADVEESSPMRRHRALAEALFGAEDSERPISPPVPSQPPQISIMPDMSSPEPESNDDEPIEMVLSPTRPLQTPKRSDSLRHAAAKASTATPPLNAMPTSPMSPLSPTAGMDPTQLALEVQRRAEAATLALRKSPSIPKIGNEGSGTLPRKRISPNKISSPTLVSASTSVDAIPLRSPTASPTPQMLQSSSKIGSRFKKLRGTIRAKHQVPNGEEITPYPLELRSPNAGAPSGSSPSLALRTDPVPMSAGYAEPTRLKPPPAPIATPPASATPGLKGFMARFRKQRVAAEPLVPPARHVPGPMSAVSAKSLGLPSPSEQMLPPMPQSAPALKTVFRSPSPAGPASPPPQSPTPRPPQDAFVAQSSAQAQTDDALKQLFDAATNLGLDQAALNDLIARSPSTSSRSTAWTRLTRATSPNESRKSQIPIIRGRVTPDSVRSPTSEGRPSYDGYSPRPSTDTRPPIRKSQELPQRPRQHQEAGQNTVVRRTIIFPSDSRASGVDLTALIRKHSTSRKRSSVGSKSSIHDRVPTPPPPHRAGGRRFSTDSSPPVPQLPPTFAVQAEGMLAAPNMSNSAYDSLYEMYAGDSRGQTLSAESPGAGSSQAQREVIPEAGPALEVIEMANGETIWSIVNGLRDDDGESYYGDRASFYSEYSVKDTNENMKLFFKEHERKSSKGSTSSFLSRRKTQTQQPKGSARPETKVFFSSSAQIGRLIENLSRGMDAGSFNIMPGQGSRSQGHVGHSTSSSMGSQADMGWTVEERLEHMLGSMGAT
ncbi:hypothetical protein GY45DRAFT_1324417 [Cubamyces sp. BRFM 1775]|nr:hypothetical protein GY45DRAFT_1324417 [Cubamyces sp. BRFM 1775]